VWVSPTSCRTPSIMIWNPNVPMMQLKTIIPNGCIRDLPAGYMYLLLFFMFRSVRYKIKPETRSKKESSAEVMMLSEPLTTAAYVLIPRRRTFAQNEICSANSSRFSRFASPRVFSAASSSDARIGAPVASVAAMSVSISPNWSTSAFCLR